MALKATRYINQLLTKILLFTRLAKQNKSAAGNRPLSSFLLPDSLARVVPALFRSAKNPNTPPEYPMTAQLAYPQPEWNSPDSVSTALEAVSNARDKESSQVAYNKLLYAVGNNHAGTYYPIVLSVVADLEPILRSGEIWPQHTVIEALIDLFISFVPAPGQEVFCGRSLSAALRERIIALKQCFALIASGNDVAATSAKDILKHLNEQAEQDADGNPH